jgi:hypothetical protein
MKMAFYCYGKKGVCESYPICKGTCEHFDGTGGEHITRNADRIRAMSDEELKYIARAVIKSQDCPMGETECTDCVFHDLCLRGDYYYNNEEEWLKQPAEVRDNA